SPVVTWERSEAEGAPSVMLTAFACHLPRYSGGGKCVRSLPPRHLRAQLGDLRERAVGRQFGEPGAQRALEVLRLVAEPFRRGRGQRERKPDDFIGGDRAADDLAQPGNA